MKMIKNVFVIVFAFMAVLFSAGNRAVASEGMTVVPNKRVCMVTNMLFPRDQIPVAHNGKTYYGCCENCKETLTKDASARTALDPLSKKPVDKAKAIIGAREDGSVVYFESLASFKKYQKNNK